MAAATVASALPLCRSAAASVFAGRALPRCPCSPAGGRCGRLPGEADPAGGGPAASHPRRPPPTLLLRRHISAAGAPPAAAAATKSRGGGLRWPGCGRRGGQIAWSPLIGAHAADVGRGALWHHSSQSWEPRSTVEAQTKARVGKGSAGVSPRGCLRLQGLGLCIQWDNTVARPAPRKWVFAASTSCERPVSLLRSRLFRRFRNKTHRLPLQLQNIIQ